MTTNNNGCEGVGEVCLRLLCGRQRTPRLAKKGSGKISHGESSGRDTRARFVLNGEELGPSWGRPRPSREEGAEDPDRGVGPGSAPQNDRLKSILSIHCSYPFANTKREI